MIVCVRTGCIFHMALMLSILTSETSVLKSYSILCSEKSSKFVFRGKGDHQSKSRMVSLHLLLEKPLATYFSICSNICTRREAGGQL